MQLSSEHNSVNSNENFDYFHNVNSVLVNLDGDSRYFLRFNILGLQLHGLLDSGSDISLVGEQFGSITNFLQLQPLEKNINISSASGHAMNILGFVDIPFNVNEKTKILPCLVVEELENRCILGMDFFKLFNIELKFNEENSSQNLFTCNIQNNNENQPNAHTLTAEQNKMLAEVKNSFKTSEPNTLDACNVMEHKIELTDNTAIHLNPHPWSPTIQKKVNVEIERLLQMDIIEPSNSNWALQVVPVTKENGDMRLCLDARKLNAKTVRDAYPLASTMRILHNLGKNKYFTVIDLKESFLQVKLAESSKKYTSFKILGRGLFQYKRLPFGLINSSATMSRILDIALKEGKYEPFIFSYLDDIIIATDNFEDHIKYLKIVADCLREANLSVNLQKC